MTKPRIVAHRGDQEHFPENTLPAFASAIDKGADVIEFDVHETLDGQTVVHHDYYLDQRSSSTGFIGDFTLNELQEIDAGSWFNPNFQEVRIPTLDEVLDLGKTQIRFEIEIKDPSVTLVKNVIEKISGFGVIDDVVITCQHLLLHKAIKELNPKIESGMIFLAYPDWMQEELAIAHYLAYMELSRAQYAHLTVDIATNKMLKEIARQGYRTHIACNEHKYRIEEFISLNPDQISTNFLDKALEIRRKLILKP